MSCSKKISSFKTFFLGGGIVNVSRKLYGQPPNNNLCLPARSAFLSSNLKPSCLPSSRLSRTCGRTHSHVEMECFFSTDNPSVIAYSLPRVLLRFQRKRIAQGLQSCGDFLHSTRKLEFSRNLLTGGGGKSMKRKGDHTGSFVQSST